MIVLLCGVGGLAGRALALTFTEFPISTDSRPVGITTGPDGALWFTEPYLDKIGRIATRGVIIEFEIPTPGSFPIDITQGPDGALWFTENAANQIDRITTDGVITEFKIPTAS